MDAQFFTTLWNILLTKGQWLLLLVIVDVVAGISASVKAKAFDWDKLPEFLGNYGLKVLGWVLLEIVALVPLESSNIVTTAIGQVGNAAYVTLMAGAVASIVKSIRELGILPDGVARATIKAGLPEDPK
jgi:hypothetical protein